MGGGTGRGGRAQEEGPEEVVQGGGNTREMLIGIEVRRGGVIVERTNSVCFKLSQHCPPLRLTHYLPKTPRHAGRFFTSFCI